MNGSKSIFKKLYTDYVSLLNRQDLISFQEEYFELSEVAKILLEEKIFFGYKAIGDGEFLPSKTLQEIWVELSTAEAFSKYTSHYLEPTYNIFWLLLKVTALSTENIGDYIQNLVEIFNLVIPGIAILDCSGTQNPRYFCGRGMVVVNDKFLILSTDIEGNINPLSLQKYLYQQDLTKLTPEIIAEFPKQRLTLELARLIKDKINIELNLGEARSFFQNKSASLILVFDNNLKIEVSKNYPMEPPVVYRDNVLINTQDWTPGSALKKYM